MNSRAFWEQYFEDDWGVNDGPLQSRHFMLQLLAHLPLPELQWLIEPDRSILDWGCATGEGTAVLARLLPNSQVTGLDFAKHAIDEASQRHPEAKFVWTSEGEIPDDFDVVVTSNCLEHFEDPLAVATDHVRHCRSLYIILVPYKEHPLHDQHFAQFRDESFPDAIGGFSRLAVVPFSVNNEHWPGWQVLAIYGSDFYLEGRTRPENLPPYLSATAASLSELTLLTYDVAGLTATLRSSKHSNAELRSSLEATEGRLETTADALAATRTELSDERYAREALASELREINGAHDDQVQRLDSEIASLADQLGRSTQLLVQEETRILRPLLRRALHTGRAVGRRLPAEWQDTVRAYLAPAARRLAPNSAQAMVYQIARQRRSGPPRPVSTTVSPSRTELDARCAEAFWHPSADAQSQLTFVIFPVIDWHFRFQRPQQLARALGKRGHRVFYISPDFLLSKDDKPFEVLESPARNVHLCRLACSPPHPRLYETLLSPEQIDEVATNLFALEAYCAGAPIIRVVQHPFWTQLMRQWDDGFLIYDMMDDHSGFLGNGGWLPQQEQELLSAADLVTVAADMLATKARDSKACIIIKNAADRDHFVTVRLRPSGEVPVRVGYYGAISHWFDSALVSESAKAHPEWEFELVGSTFRADLRDLGSLPNVLMRGEQPYDAIRGYLSNWDVGMIPFKLLPLTLATNPVKVYEYLSAGRPVVATALPELTQAPLSEWVRVASGPVEFTAALEAAVVEARDPELARQRSYAVRDESWDDRAERLESGIAARLPKVSVVVVCYGQLELTKLCIQSLLGMTSYPDWELVAVDNASPDGSAQWLEQAGREWERVRVVLNSANLGFPGGVNSGVRAASGEYIVILNNDTQVSPGWLGRLVRHLRENDDLGLVGAVTNAIGNEAAIEIKYKDGMEMIGASRRYVAGHFRSLMPVQNVAFFAVAFRRDTWERVGELDERFGLGFFEDDDYCRRVSESGLKIAVAEDVFVHHELSASFDLLGSGRKQAQFEDSRRVFEEKWGAWTPHKYRNEFK